MLATQLNPLVEEEQLSSNCICQINRFIVNTLKDGRYVFFVFVFGFLYLFIYLASSGLSCSMQDLSLECSDSSVVMSRLSCSGACGIIVPQVGVKPVCPGPPGKSLWYVFFRLYCVVKRGLIFEHRSLLDARIQLGIKEAVVSCQPRVQSC